MTTLNKLTVTLLLLSLLGCGRQMDKDEIVFNDYVFEENGIYYIVSGSTHSNYRKYTGTDTGYHDNGKIWGTSIVKKGLPDGHWEQFDSNGTKKLDLYFDNGNLTKKSAY
jgi:antitoxin component YwqK of YwqJK toxin-antitoxin module